MDFEERLSRVALAFGIGLLIGAERGWHTRSARPGSRTAGVRTFAISGLLGGIVGAVAQDGGDALTVGGGLFAGIAFAAYAFVIAMFCRDENRAAKIFSATTTIAALLTFVLGVYASLGDVRVAAAAAVVTAGVLMIREALHEWVAKITLAEFESGLVLLAMTFIALPIVPDRSFGPFGGVNPREVWIIAIVLASVSFAGYVAVKTFGERSGILLASALGGVVSSTAVTLANARRAIAGESSPHLLAAGAMLATSVSFVRVAAIVAALKPELLAMLAPPLLAAAVLAAGFAVAAVYWRKRESRAQTAVSFRNPFGFWLVIGFAVSMGVLILVGKGINEKFGALGALVGATAMGLFDVDAMTVSMTRLATQSAELPRVAYAILAGVASNTLCKLVIGALIGRGRFAALVAAVSVACAVVGWLTLVATMTLDRR